MYATWLYSIVYIGVSSCIIPAGVLGDHFRFASNCFLIRFYLNMKAVLRFTLLEI